MYKNTPMPSHIDLDEALVREVVRLGHFTTKKAAVNAALAEYARLLQRRQLLDLCGKVSWEGDLNEMRGRPTR
jgi:Arc/MetJ family transcription regulator